MTTWCVLVGFLIDAIIGDPEKLPHPVRFIGALIGWLDRKLCHPEEPVVTQRVKSLLLVVLTLIIPAGITAGLLYVAGLIHPICTIVLTCIIDAQMLAARNLRDASHKVYVALKRGDTEGARFAVSMIVGRDTESLDEAGITRAAVETVAENTSDGVTAPLICLLIGGPVLGMLYKSINTMDSMIGYRNDRYRVFGTIAAKLDDIVNYLPARISGVLMVAAAALCGLDPRGARKIYIRDRYNHASPNSAQTESACAGALGVQLAGDASYFGKIVHKPTIGDATRPIEAEDIRRANRLMYVTSILTLVIGMAIRCLIVYGRAI